MEGLEENLAGGTLQRVLRLIHCFTDEQPSWGVRELARTLGMHHTTTHRLLKGLAAEGWLQFDPQVQRYTIGVELYRLGLKLTSRLDIASIARPHMQQLARAVRENVYLCLYAEERQELMMVAVEESENPLRYIPELYRYLPLHTGATGRSILSFLPEPTIDEVLQKSRLTPITEQTITDPNRLRAMMERTRAQGYAVSYGERLPESVALGAPIRDASGRVKGSIAVIMPKYRWDPARESEWAALVMAAANGTSRALGR